MHESPKWLAAHLGKTEAYWEDLQKSLNAEFAARGVARTPTSAVATKIIESAVEQGYSAPTFEGVIPAYRDEPGKQTYAFPTQFDDFGLRTKSGVSLVDWTDPRITLETRARVDDAVEIKAGPRRRRGASSADQRRGDDADRPRTRADDGAAQIRGPKADDAVARIVRGPKANTTRSRQRQPRRSTAWSSTATGASASARRLSGTTASVVFPPAGSSR